MKKIFIALSFIAFVFCSVQEISAQTVNQTTRDVVITETPQPGYTDAARENSIEGTITARVTFKADGTIGKIFLVNRLPHGLNQKAIEAARKIKFFPAIKNNVPITVIRKVEYNFKLQIRKGIGDGSGFGDGMGSGRGSGKGSGTGSGTGSGDGNGIGLGDDSDDEDKPQIIIKPKPTNVTKSLNILSKPRANYTDEARQNNVQGTVTLRVTFNANGTIGEVTPISTLPYGLTEQAISAAKRMTFQPAMKNGVPYTVTKQVPYTFTIY